MAKQTPYLKPAGALEQWWCDWCDQLEIIQDFYHGDMHLLTLCNRCIQTQEKGN